MLGYPPYPKSPGEKYKRKFESKDNYEKLLRRVFNMSACVMSEDAVVYVRTDAREYTFNTTREILNDCFPEKKEKIKERPVSGGTQTSLYGNESQKPGEIDIVMT